MSSISKPKLPAGWALLHLLRKEACQESRLSKQFERLTAFELSQAGEQP